ncbi:hypothetical protein DRP53_00335 [candidate division WOR-3 bacterium]|uniref:Uncharacterized protein n=1 Tax=candidate division WOR-3 bacterium TaxID=2052148 RepID=A0A660SLT4_UNCW3|nr:MAG: hypothetical protein DRP53_00335 [candidate division WOR-3 bacterium]
MIINPWNIAAALLTLFILSFLYKDNPLFRFAEHLYVGISNGYLIAITWHNALRPNLFDPLGRGQYIFLIPMVLGLLYFTMFVKRISWLARLPIAFLIGWGAGVSIPAYFQANILKQLHGTILTPQSFQPQVSSGIWATIILIGVVATLTYFFFSTEHKGAIGRVSRLGIIFIMIGFGASFGYTVMARVSLFIGRLKFLIEFFRALF